LSVNSLTLPTIRDEAAGDEAAIRHVHEAAFLGPLEGRLVDDLRRSGRLAISLVAPIDGQIAGHIAFSSPRLPFYRRCNEEESAKH
jgi:putative acetyltransferase